MEHTDIHALTSVHIVARAYGSVAYAEFARGPRSSKNTELHTQAGSPMSMCVDGPCSRPMIRLGMAPSMAWRFEGRLTVVVHGQKNPSNLEWQSMLMAEAARGRSESGRTLIVSYGGGPDGRQRELLTQQMTARPAPTCIMTASPLVRAITAALLFFNRGMKVVGLDERARAYDFLALSAVERDSADRLRREAEAAIGITPPPAAAERR